jgi:CubicO group peptidase (beta-lactamase class C family)
VTLTEGLDYPYGNYSQTVITTWKYLLYLNFGYCVLDRVLERVAGMTCEEYVQRDILTPYGINDMQIGRNSLADGLPGEVNVDLPKQKRTVKDSGRGF